VAALFVQQLLLGTHEFCAQLDPRNFMVVSRRQRLLQRRGYSPENPFPVSRRFPSAGKLGLCRHSLLQSCVGGRIRLGCVGLGVTGPLLSAAGPSFRRGDPCVGLRSCELNLGGGGLWV
jgi:hypothetical protein